MPITMITREDLEGKRFPEVNVVFVLDEQRKFVEGFETAGLYFNDEELAAAQLLREKYLEPPFRIVQVMVRVLSSLELFLECHNHFLGQE